MSARAAIIFLAVLMGNEFALACRCEQRDLADYFNAADQVVIAEHIATDTLADEKRASFRLSSAPYKGSEHNIAGGKVIYSTALSTASCGVSLTPSAIYILFAYLDKSSDSGYRIDTCSGTREFLSAERDISSGFRDVPSRFVAQQLNGLAGIEVLQQVAANLPDEADVSNASLIGLLDVKVFSHGGFARIFAEPRTSSVLLIEAKSYDDLVTREVGYEQPAGVVFARDGGWYRLRLTDGRYGWLAPEEAGTYFAYRLLPVRRLAYLNREWSGFVWPAAGAGLPSRFARASDDAHTEFPVNVLESTEIGGALWFRVEVLAGDPCSGSETGIALAGWVPGYGISGQPTTWFYSRGC